MAPNLPLFLFVIPIAFAQQSSSADAELQKLLTNERLQWDEMMSTPYIPIPMLDSEIWSNAQLSMDDTYDSLNKYPPKMAFNHLIGSQSDIEVILSENDKELTEQLMDGFDRQLQHTLKDINMDSYWQFVSQMSGKSEEKLRNKSSKKKEYPPFNMNGASSDYRYLSHMTESTGMNSEYWSVSDECIKHKGCNVYPIFRVIHASKPYDQNSKILSFSCTDILTLLLPQIYACVEEYGLHKCPLIIDSGHFRWVFKAKIPDSNNKFVVIKMMKQTSKETPRDLLRHLRESIFLYYLRNEERAFMDKFGESVQFTSNLNEKRGFPYVYELGHCISPHYISVSHYYNMTIEKFIEKGYAKRESLQTLLRMSLDIAKGIEILHSIVGGPYHHTDIRSDQFMLDSFGNVLINDFNRGKFQPFFFPNEDYGLDQQSIEKCNFCPHSSNGALRAPEEQMSLNLDESIDVYSAALVIWSLFANTENVFGNVKSNDIGYLVYETARRPSMPSNMPFALKEIVRGALAQNPKRRPSAKEFRQAIQSIYEDLDKYTRKNADLTAEEVKNQKLFQEKHYPRVSKDFPEFEGKSGET